MKLNTFITAVILIYTLAPTRSFAFAIAGRSLHVSAFGAVPDDGICDMAAIHKAIQAAANQGATEERFAGKERKGKARSSQRAANPSTTEVRFAAGVYDLIEPVAIQGKEQNHYINISKAKDLTLTGAVDASGRPTTRLERHVKLNNDSDPYYELSISDSRNIAIRNVILANNPPLGSTARVTAVEKASDEVTVEVLDGLPAYDGMRCASAHAWNLETGKIKRFGASPNEGTLTIGLNIKAFWEAVPGTDARKLKMRGAGFSKKVEVGDGISWHHKSTDAFNQVQVMKSEGVVFDNILMPNVSNAGMLFGYNRNITLRKVRFEPEHGNLAVGGRDGIHLSNSSGDLLVEDCYFKGLRMDPLVLRKTFGIVQEVRADGSIVSKPGYTLAAGDKIRFWVGDEPQDRVIKSMDVIKGGLYHYFFEKSLPEGVKKDTVISFQSYTLDKGVIRNCLFEGNFGSAIVNFEENITVEGCGFRDNSYQIKYGANHVSGAFARNNIFRKNFCEDTSWIDIAGRGQPATLVVHSLSKFFKEPRYNQHIEIYGNIFKNPHAMKTAVAIHVLNAEDVNIHDNTFEGFERDVLVGETTTRNIRVQRGRR
jgi:hypothetical protein